ncbi:unnamed protein product [Polarella glacialis]|uniref:Uncharacterized protein n=1 Tax=Polarella glacialis TaxID=89957 RepID=A0A813GS64_POLGL|nr:unnamed protein product [Polarella glacialis]
MVMLRSSGMSTPALREAFLHGADVRGVGNISYSNLCFSMGMWFVFQVIYLGLDGKSPGLLSFWIILSLACPVMCNLWWFFRASSVQRAFAVAVSSKFAMLALATALYGMFALFESTGIYPVADQEAAYWGASLGGFTALTCLCCHLGLAGIARIPLCGPWLTGFLGPGNSLCWCKRQSLE